jgi:hypothetical protein
VPQEDRLLTLDTRSDETEKAIRDLAIENLSSFLSHGGRISEEGSDISLDGNASGGRPLTEGEMRRLWKGLFYCEISSR